MLGALYLGIFIFAYILYTSPVQDPTPTPLTEPLPLPLVNPCLHHHVLQLTAAGLQSRDAANIKVGENIFKQGGFHHQVQ